MLNNLNLFIKIASEPVGIIACLGIVLLILDTRKSRKLSFYLYGIIFILFLLWRIVIPLDSQRYAAILIYPALLFCGYCCYSMSLYFTQIIKRKQWQSSLFILMIGGIVVGGLGKSFHFNPYNREVLTTMKHIKNYNEKISSDTICLDDGTKYLNLIEPITDINVVYIGTNFIRSNAPVKPEALSAYKYLAKTIFFSSMSKTPEGDTTALPFDINNWSVYAAIPYDRRKISYWIVYKYEQDTSFKRKINKFHEKEYYSTVTNNLIENGNFEAPGNYSASIKKIILESNEAKFLGIDSNNISSLPDQWSIAKAPGYHTYCDGKLKIVDTADHGKALNLSSLDRISIYSLKVFPSGKYRLKFIANGNQGTIFGLSRHIYNSNSLYTNNLPLAQIQYIENDLMEYSITFISPDKFRLGIEITKGNITIDELIMEKTN